MIFQIPPRPASLRGDRLSRTVRSLRLVCSGVFGRLGVFVLAGLLPVGCANVVPGLNLPETEEGVHEIQVPAKGATVKAEWPPYGPREVPPPPSALPESGVATPERYRLVRVTPQVVASLRQASATVLGDPVSELPDVSPAYVPPEYRVGPGDVLFVTVWDHPELAQPVKGGLQDLAVKEGRLVAADGTMYYPYAGTLRVGGLTCAEIRESLAGRLKDVILEPKVDVKVVNYRAHRVQVTGEVRKPGTFTLDDAPKGVLQALDDAGGLSQDASRRRAILVRGKERFTIDLASLLSGDAPARNPMVRPGDVIHVPSRADDRIFVLGEVEKAQPVYMERMSMPLIEALTLSGGLDKARANDSGVLVFRNSGAGADVSASVYAIDVSSAGGFLLASQFPLRESDIVYVMSTALSRYNTVISQILPTAQLLWQVDQVMERNDL